MDGVTYDIVREFWGSIEMIGGSVSVSGKIHDSTSNELDIEVGYFTLIDSAASEEKIDGVSSIVCGGIECIIYRLNPYPVSLAPY